MLLTGGLAVVCLLAGVTFGWLAARRTARIPAREMTCVTARTAAVPGNGLLELLLRLDQSGVTPAAAWPGDPVAGKTPLFALFTNHDRAVLAARTLNEDPKLPLIGPIQVRPASCAFDRA